MLISRPLIGYVIKAALRDRLILSLFLLVTVGASIAVFIGSSAITESDKFALVFAAGGLRLAGVIGLTLFVSFHIRRSFESSDIDFLLSRPISRPAFLFSHAIAFSVLAIIVALFIMAALFVMMPHAFGEGHLLWSFSLTVEFIIVANAALFFAMVLPGGASSALAVLAFYVLARLMGQIIGIMAIGTGLPGSEALSFVMEIISFVVPRLDMMAQTSWLVYGRGDIGYGFILLQGVVYVALLNAASMIDLVRRQF